MVVDGQRGRETRCPKPYRWRAACLDGRHSLRIVQKRTDLDNCVPVADADATIYPV